MSYFDLSAIDAEIAEPIVVPKKSRIASKLVANLAAGAVSSVVVSIIHQNTTTYNRGQKAKLYIGAYVLGAMAADKAAVYVEEQVATYFVAIENFLWIPVEPDFATSAVEIDKTQNDLTEQ